MERMNCWQVLIQSCQDDAAHASRRLQPH
jgi:hypothetical protein